MRAAKNANKSSMEWATYTFRTLIITIVFHQIIIWGVCVCGKGGGLWLSTFSDNLVIRWWTKSWESYSRIFTSLPLYFSHVGDPKVYGFADSDCLQSSSPWSSPETRLHFSLDRWPYDDILHSSNIIRTISSIFSFTIVLFQVNHRNAKWRQYHELKRDVYFWVFLFVVFVMRTTNSGKARLSF